MTKLTIKRKLASWILSSFDKAMIMTALDNYLDRKPPLCFEERMYVKELKEYFEEE